MPNSKDAPAAEAAEIIRKQAAEIARLLDAKRRALVIADDRSKENAALHVEIKRLRTELENDVRYDQAATKKA